MKKMHIRIFLRLAALALLMSSSIIVSGQPESEVSKPQYLFKDFSNSTIRMKDGHSENSVMNYNIVSGMMVFMKNDKYYDLTNPELIDTVYINESRFIPVKDVFGEVLVTGTLPCFIQHVGNLMPVGKDIGYGGTSQASAVMNVDNVVVENRFLTAKNYNLELPPDYSVETSLIFWIRKGTEYLSFQNEKQFLQLFPDKVDQIKSFLKKNKLKIGKPEDLKAIIRFTSSLM
jgi:hypothetical protein